MATATAPSHNYCNLSENPNCLEDWKRLERKAFPESAQSDDGYHSACKDQGGGANGTNTLNSRGREDESNFLSSYEPGLSELSRQLLSTSASAITNTPWRTKAYSCDPAGLHEEINDFYEYMKPRPSEVRMRVEVIQRVMNIILYRFPYARIEPFGSFITGLFLPTSDVDLVVFSQPQPSLYALEEDFQANDIAVEGTIQVLDKTAVPVIKFIDKQSGVRVDISFNKLTGLRSAEFIRQCIEAYPFLPKLVLLLKQFLTQRSLHEVFIGGISSYSLILLVVNFLQLHPRRGSADLSLDLGTLLIEFFELYGKKFNYKKAGICVTDGGKYIAKEEHNIQDFLYIEDPVILPDNKYELNAARGCYGIWQVKQAFEQAFTRLSSAVLSRENPVPQRESILGAIIKVSTDVEKYRIWADSSWSTQPLSPPTTVTQLYYPAPVIMPTLPPFNQFPQHAQQQFTPLAMSNELEAVHIHHQHKIIATSSSPPSHSSEIHPSNSATNTSNKS